MGEAKRMKNAAATGATSSTPVRRDQEEITARMTDLAEVAFNLDYAALLAAAKRRLVVFKVEKKRVIDLSTSLTSAQLAKLPLSYETALAGYRVNVGALVPGLQADILVLRDDVLAYPDGRLNPLLIHELSHWVVSSGHQITITPQDQKQGIALYGMTDPEFEQHTQHTQQWCTVLISAVRKMVAAGRILDIVAFLEDALPVNDRPKWDATRFRE